eukprot:364788-Chlamydomonas_euryale.AAC.10
MQIKTCWGRANNGAHCFELRQSQGQSYRERTPKVMPVLSTARQSGSSSGLSAITKGTPLRAVQSHRGWHPIPNPTTTDGNF